MSSEPGALIPSPNNPVLQTGGTNTEASRPVQGFLSAGPACCAASEERRPVDFECHRSAGAMASIPGRPSSPRSAVISRCVSPGQRPNHRLSHPCRRGDQNFGPRVGPKPVTGTERALPSHARPSAQVKAHKRRRRESNSPTGSKTGASVLKTPLTSVCPSGPVRLMDV
jgi:hypothetical protein